MNATYISTNSFSVASDRTLEFVTGRRVKCDCGVDGIVYADVVSATYSAVTTVVIDENSLTSNLVTVLYGVVEPGPTGSLPNHDHSTIEGMGGTDVSLIYLTDTPTTYSGAGALLVTTESGIEFTYEGRWYVDSGDPYPIYPVAFGGDGSFYLDKDTDNVWTQAPYVPPNPFSGDTVTVGPTDRDYTTIAAGIAAANDGDIISIDAGSYNEIINVNKHVHLRCVTPGSFVEIWSNTYTATITVSPATTFCNNIKTMYFENVYLYSTGDNRSGLRLEFVTTDLVLILNKCKFGNNVHRQPIKNWMNTTAGAQLRVINCYIDRNPVYYHFEGMNDPWSIERTELDSGYVCNTCTETPDQADYVSIPTTEYGVAYGSYYLNGSIPNIQWQNIGNINGGTFLDLSDTPTTYSGTEGAMLVSTGSGTTFTHEGVWLSGTNAPNWEGEIGNYYIDTTTEIIYKKNREHADIVALSAKSVILEVANNWGQTQYSRLRSVEFKRDGVLIDLLTADFTTYASSYHWGYPSQYDPNFLFDTSKSKIDSSTYTEWSTAQNDRLNQWVTVVFDEVIWFDEVVVNNSHLNGGVNSLIYGSKDAKLIISSDEITTHVYGDPISNSETVFTGQFTIHPAVNAVADQVLDIDDALALEDLDTGWDAVITVRKNLIELDDTPSTYSGTEGAMLVSTGSGTEFTQEGRWLGGDGAPTRFLGNLGNYYLDETGGGVYERARIPITPSGIIAKSLVFEGADTWGATTEMGCRSIEFKLDGTLLPLVYTDFTANQSDAYDASYYARHVFDTTLSKTGTHASTSWQTYGAGTNVNQWMTVAFDTEIEFDEIIVNNFHATGGLINRGMKNTKIYISSDEITTHVYGDPISNSTLIFDGTFLEHVASDTIDDKDVDITTAVSTITGVALLDTCWDMVLLSATAASILDLTDTPSTYSGTDGAMLVSTGSGTEFTQEGRWLAGGDVTPTADLGIKGNYYLDEVAEIVYKKNRDIIIPAFYAKSIVFEFADNWGYTSRMGCRSIEFKLNGVLSELVDADYDSNHSSAYSSDLAGGLLFDTTLSKTGTPISTSWRSASITSISNQWVTVVFDDILEFDEIVVNNCHSSGSNTNYGVKNTKIYISSDSITSHTYGDPISNSTEIFDSIVPKHVVGDVVDNQVLDVSDALLGQAENTGWDRVLLSASSVSLLDLTDTPTTYSGAEGQYLRATASGTEWATASDNFLGLTDTPITYSGTYGAMLVSTGSATQFTQEGRWFGGSNTPLAVGEVGNYYLAETPEEVYKKNRQDVTYFTARSVIIDIADNYGQVWYIGIRSVEFKLDGVLLDVNGTVGATAYTTTNFDGNYLPIYSFDVSKSKLGNWLGTQWLSGINQDDNQRLICVFDIDQDFDEIVINNGHSIGIATDASAKNIKIHISTDEITSTVYNQAIANSTLLFDGVLDEHIVSDIIDDQVIDIDDALAALGADTGWDRVLLSASSASLLDLTDTPTTYSGAEGQYLRATASGTEWATVAGGVQTFLALPDTPSTYSGTEGAMLVSTGSGTEFTQEGRWYTNRGAPLNSYGSRDNLYLDKDTNEIYMFVSTPPSSGIQSPNDETVLLLHMDGTDGANSFTDDGTGTNCPHSITAVNGVITEEDAFKFGSTSAYYPSSSTHRLYTDSSADFNFGTAAFSIDFFVKFSTGAGNQYLFDIGSNGLYMRMVANVLDINALGIFYSWAPDTNWHHLAFDADGAGNQYMYVDGFVVGSSSSAASLGATTVLSIGDYGGGTSYSLAGGYIDEFRVVKGVQSGNGTTYPVPAVAYNSPIVIENEEWLKTGSITNYSKFIYLTDTPTTYSGAEGKYLRATTSGTEWSDVSANLVDLNDTPSTYDDGKYLRSVVSGTEWSDVSANLVDLNDTPSIYDTGKYLRSVVSGTEWSDVSANLVDLNDTPETYDYGKALVSTTSGTAWGTATVTTVTGTILYGTGNPPSAVGLVDGTLFFKYVN